MILTQDCKLVAFALIQTTDMFGLAHTVLGFVLFKSELVAHTFKNLEFHLKSRYPPSPEKQVMWQHWTHTTATGRQVESTTVPVDKGQHHSPDLHLA